MIFIIGYQNSVKELGPVEEIDCRRCNNKRFWLLAKATNYISLFFIPLFPVSSNAYKYCPICRNSEALTKEQFANAEEMANHNQEALKGTMTAEEYDRIFNTLKK